MRTNIYIWVVFNFLCLEGCISLYIPSIQVPTNIEKSGEFAANAGTGLFGTNFRAAYAPTNNIYVGGSATIPSLWLKDLQYTTTSHEFELFVGGNWTIAKNISWESNIGFGARNFKKIPNNNIYADISSGTGKKLFLQSFINFYEDDKKEYFGFGLSYNNQNIIFKSEIMRNLFTSYQKTFNFIEPSIYSKLSLSKSIYFYTSLSACFSNDANKLDDFNPLCFRTGLEFHFR